MHLPSAARASVFAIIAVAWLIVFATPEYGVIWLVAGAAVLGAAWRSDGRWAHGPRAAKTRRIVAVLMLVALPFDILFLTQSVLHPAIHVALVTQGLFLFDAPSLQRHRLLVLLSLFDVLAATQLTQSLVFAALFIVYAGLAIVSLTLLHLGETAAALADRQASDERGRIEALRLRAIRPLGLALLAAAAAVVPLIVVLFLTLPRWEYSIIARAPSNTDALERLQQLERARKQTGFSENIELGDYGRVQEDPTVIMRVKFPRGRPEELANGEMYWRAGALDYYDGYSWATSKPQFAFYRAGRSTDAERGRLVLARGRGHVAPAFGTTFLLSSYFRDTEVSGIAPLREDPELVEQEIYLELPYADNLVGLATLVAVDGFFPRGLSTDMNASFRVRSRPLLAEKVSYTAFSTLPPVDVRALGGVQLAEYRPLLEHPFFGPFYRQHYLQVPENLTPDVRRLVAELTADQPTVDAKVAALLEYFGAFTYSLQTGRVSLTGLPLDDFLFNTQEGYCEHFATAMVVMLRTAGLPARLANGFKGGVWNEPGGFYAVRQADAHTWAEVWVPRHGWIAVDPVPGGDAAAGAQPWLVPAQNSYMMYARAFWQEQVLGYNLANQTRFARLTWDWLRQRPGVMWSWLRRILAAIGAALATLLGLLVTWATVLVPVALAGILVALYFWRTGLPGGTVPLPGRQGPRVPFYFELLRSLRRAGFAKELSDPPRVFAGRVGRARPDLAEDVTAITRLYERVRFAGRGLSAPEGGDVRAALTRVRRAARRAPAGVPDANR